VTNYQNGFPTLIAARIYHEFQHRDNLSLLAMEGMLLELFAEMSRCSTLLNENECPRWLRKATDYVHTHFTECPSIDVIASTVCVHPSHLMRGFRQYHHCTIGDYTRKLRVEYACHLLSTSDTPLGQIALAAGFADQSHFNLTFKGFMGMTPTMFRKASGRKAFSVQVRNKK
jgi:AraC family transcriptional regulator